MDKPQRCITVPHRVHNNADRKQIVYLVQGFILIHHLLINTEKMFDSAIYLRMNTRVVNMAAYIAHNLVNKSLPFALLQIDFFHQFIIDFRVQVF